MDRLTHQISFTLVLAALVLLGAWPRLCFSSTVPEEIPWNQDERDGSFHLSISEGLISLQAREADLKEVLAEISKITGVEIVFDRHLAKRISVSFFNKPLDEALKRIAQNRGIVFAQEPGKEDWRIMRVVVLPGSAGPEKKRTGHERPVGSAAAPDLTVSSPRDVESGPLPSPGTSGGIIHKKSGTKPSFVSKELIVRFKSEVSQQEIKALIARAGARIKRSIEAINYFVISLPPSMPVNEALEWFRQQGGVEKVEPNYLIPLQEAPQVFPEDPYFHAYQWSLHNTGQTGGPEDADVDAPEAWEIEQGRPEVVMAIIDTGIDYDHPDLGANIWENTAEIEGVDGTDDDGNGFMDDTMGWDFVDEDNDPRDAHGHGSHVAGIAGAVANNGLGIAGLAWNCRIMPVRAGNSEGVFTSEHAAEAIIYAAENKANVINLSWGGYEKISLIDDAMTFATDRGALICAAAGNDDSSDLIYPAAYRNNAVIAVGATDDEDRKAVFSNYGDWVHVSAPGDGPAIGESSLRGIYSTYLNGGYRQLRGTSMATPHVGAAAALLFSHFPDISAIEVKTRIMRSADVLSDLSGKNITSGRLNAYRALTEAYHTPYIFSVRPNEAHEGDRISIFGDRFGANQMGGGVVALQGGLEAEIIAWDDSAITCKIPEGAQSGEVRVTTEEGASNGRPLRILVRYYKESLVGPRFLGGGSPMGWHADDALWPYELPFLFPFFGVNYDRVFVCSNGFLIFGEETFYSYDNSTDTFKTKVMVAPLWDDLVTSGSSDDDVYVDSSSADSVSFRWAGRRYGQEDPVNVEAVLYQDGRIEFHYGEGNVDLSPTIGISGGDGSQYHLSVYDGYADLGNVDRVLFTPVGLSEEDTDNNGRRGGGDHDCFIATAAFGSPLNRHVCVLRAFRDRHLARCGLGRKLIRLYETTSPPLARLISEHEPLRALVRLLLLPAVALTYVTLYFGVKATLGILAFLVLVPCLFVLFGLRGEAGSDTG